MGTLNAREDGPRFSEIVPIWQLNKASRLAAPRSDLLPDAKLRGATVFPRINRGGRTSPVTRDGIVFMRSSWVRNHPWWVELGRRLLADKLLACGPCRV